MKDGQKGDLRQPFLLCVRYRLVRVEMVVDEKPHLQDKEGEAGGVQTFKKANKNCTNCLAENSLRLQYITGKSGHQYWTHENSGKNHS